jgi:hypothetical protein
MKVPLTGGTPTLLAAGQTYVHGIAVDSTNVYWATGGSINAVPLNGGSVVMLASEGGTEIAVDATSVYWTSYYARNVNKVPLGGGSVVRLAKQPEPYGIAVNDSMLCWTSYSDSGFVATMGLNGGTPTVLPGSDQPPEEYWPVDIAADSTNIYWTGGTMYGSVYRQPISGGAAVALSTDKAYGAPWGIAVDATYVYFTVPNGGQDTYGTIEKVPIAGGPTTILAHTKLGDAPEAIAVDATSVYWTNTKSIQKITPK